MSKHLGNILEPIPLMDRHGADAVRWFMLAGGSPWSARRVGHETLYEIVRKVLLTYWYTASFFTLYAEANGWDPRRRRRPRAPTVPAGPVGARRARRRHRRRRRGAGGLRHPDAPAGCSRSSSTTCPTGTCAAPGAASGTATRPRWPRCTSARRPDPADGAVHAVRHRRGVGPRGGAGPGAERAADSVHLTSWPTVDEDARDDALVAQMDLVRRLVELGRSARTVGEGAHPPAAGPGAGRRAGLGGAPPRPGRRGGRRAQRGRAGRARRRRRQPTWSTSR